MTEKYSREWWKQRKQLIDALTPLFEAAEKANNSKESHIKKHKTKWTEWVKSRNENKYAQIQQYDPDNETKYLIRGVWYTETEMNKYYVPIESPFKD